MNTSDQRVSSHYKYLQLLNGFQAIQWVQMGGYFAGTWRDDSRDLALD